MAIYAVGDIQGCYTTLRLLLAQVNFNPDDDVLWCCGDLVNRGPESLATLRFLKSLGDACICVLGNHDFQLLAYAAGGKSFKGDTLDQLLAADDAASLIEWLRYRPLLHYDKKVDWCMVHAGLSPLWSLKKARKCAANIERVLRSKHWADYCKALQEKDFPEQDSKEKDERKLFVTAVLTRTRFCTAEGIFDWHHKTADLNSDEPSVQALMRPWFEHDKAKWKEDCRRVVFGHWAAKGLICHQPHVLGLDTGCVWGGALTLARLDKKKEPEIFSQAATEHIS